MYVLVIKQLVTMILIAAASFGVSKAFKFGKTEQQFASKLLLLFINPCLVLSRFDMEFDADKLKSFGIVALLSVVAHIVMFLIASIFARSKDKSQEGLDCIDKLATFLTNCGFVGIPLINGVLGDEGVFYLLAYITVFNVFVWTFGYYIMAGKINFKRIITNPNILCVIFGLILFCLPFKLPEIIAKPIQMIGSMNTPFAMILIGMLFATFNWSEGKIYARRLVKILFIRHILVAAVMFVVVFASFNIFKSIPNIRTMCYVIYIASLCPTATSISGLAVLFGKDDSYAALICMSTSIFCIVALPVSVLLAELAF